jgi:hypothetical protein
MRPRCLAAMSSSIAELMAEYSPPMPIPVTKRQKKNSAVGANAVAMVDAERDHEQALAPEDVREPADSSAPTQAPATYSDAAHPAIPPAEMLILLPLAEMAPAIDPDRHLETVEDPHRPEPDEDPPGPARPRQSVQTGRNVGLDRAEALVCWGGGGGHEPILPARLSVGRELPAGGGLRTSRSPASARSTWKPPNAR